MFADADSRECFQFRVRRREPHRRGDVDDDHDHDHESSASEEEAATTSTTLRLAGFKLDSGETDKSTGVTLWQAAPRLSTYIMTEELTSEMIVGKKVLELGAGLGLCGIVAHHLGAKRVVITDGETHALRAMRGNVEANRLDESSISCHQLLWGSSSPDHPFLAAFGTFDTILAADVVYAREGVELLFETVAMLLKPNGRFVLSWITRWNNIPEDHVLGAARTRNFRWTRPADVTGMYVFTRDSSADGTT